MSNSIVFIDSNLTDYQSLLTELGPDVEVHLLNADQDGVLQMAEILKGRTGLDAIHILSHGSDGSLSLGSGALNSSNLAQYKDALQQIGDSLTATGDLLLYGCNIAENGLGIKFINRLARLTGADVAASNDPTGNAALGGDWQLEASNGHIDNDPLALNGYAYTLAVASLTIDNGGPNAAFQADVLFANASPSSVLERNIENTDTSENSQIRLQAGSAITLNDLADDTLTLANNVSLVLQTRNNTGSGDSATGGISFQDVNDTIIASGTGSLTLLAGTGGGTPTMTLGGLSTGAGDLTVETAGGMKFTRSISSGDGDIRLAANQQTTATAGDFVGVIFDQAFVAVNGTGNLSVLGRGGNGLDRQSGVVIGAYSGLKIRGNGALTISGVGGDNAQADYSFGVDIWGEKTEISSAGGAISVTGQGGAGFGAVGIFIGSDISAGGAGSVTINGTGGSGSVLKGFGVWVTSHASIESEDGRVAVTGQGGSGAISYGVYVTDGAQINSGGNGSVSVTGTGGGSASGYINQGVVVVNAGRISAAGTGTVTVTGIGGAGSGFGVLVSDSDSQISSGGGSVIVTGQGGGSGASEKNYGVFINSGGQISAGGAGSVTVKGTGGGSESGFFNDGVVVDNAGQISTAGIGTVTVTGIGGAGSSSHGVGVYGTNTQITSGGGSVIVTGQGGSSGASSGPGASYGNFGVLVGWGAQISAGGTGSVTVNGTGGASPGFSNYGVSITSDAQITSGGGAVSVTGQGGGIGTNGSGWGVSLFDGAQISAGGAGSVTVSGTGSTHTKVHNLGVTVGLNSQITSGGGDVRVTGQGGGSGEDSSFCSGVDVSFGEISAGGIGMVTVIGTGGLGTGSNNYGVRVALGAKITSGGGSVNVTGTGNANSEAICLTEGGSITTANSNASILITADSLAITGTTLGSINAGSGTVTVQPRTAGTLINLGGADVLSGNPLTLGLTDIELDQITAGTLVIGRANAGAITVSDSITPLNTADLKLITGASVLDGNNADLNLSVAALSITAPGGIGVGDSLEINAASLTTNSSGANGNQFIAEADGLTAIDLNAGSGLISLTAAGVIQDSDSNVDVHADSAKLESGTGVGANGNAVVTIVAHLAARVSTSGDIVIHNNGALTIDIVDGLIGLSAAAGAINLSTSSPLTVSADVIATGNVTLASNDSAGGDDDLTVNNNASVQSTGGDVILDAGDDFTLAAGASITSTTGNVIISVDPVGADADTGLGGMFTIAGAITSGGVTLLLGGNDDDTFNIRSDLTANANGSNGSDTFNFGNDGSLGAGFIVGGGGADDIINGDANGNVFTITGVNSGSLTGKTNSWSAIANLGGGAGVDNFILNGGSLSGTLRNFGAGGDTLSGTGDISGALSVGSGGVISPGVDSISAINTGSLTLSVGAELAMDIDGNGGDADIINVSGSVNLSGSTLNLLKAGTFTIGQSFTLINNNGADAVIGTFDGLAEGANVLKIFPGDIAGFISYTGGSGNDVVVTIRESIEPTSEIVVADTSLTAGETSLVTITFSEAVTAFDNADLTIANGTLTAVTSSDGGVTWTATLTPNANIIDATNIISLNDSGIRDLAGNFGIGTTHSNNYAIDNDAPLTAITGLPDSIDYQEGKLPAQPLQPWSALVFQDADGGRIQQATVSIDGFKPGDWLLIDTGNSSLSAHYNSLTGLLTLTGAGSQAAYRQVLQSLKFFSTRDIITPESRDLQLTVTDPYGHLISSHTELSLKPSIIIGTPLTDSLNGTYASDLIQGLASDDQLNGFGGNDRLEGGSGNDSMNGGAGNDIILGGNGDDTLLGGIGNDRAFGGAGNDLFKGGTIGNDRYIGGGGFDTVDYRASTDGVTVSLLSTAPQFVSTDSGNDTLVSIENLGGSQYNDKLIGNAVNNLLIGYGGNDTLSGGKGQDTLTGGGGVDRFVFNTAPGAGNLDTLTDFHSGQDIIVLSAGVFTAYAGQVGQTVGLSATLSYDAGTGLLVYDADGAGALAAIDIALLGTVSHPAALGNDFLIVA